MPHPERVVHDDVGVGEVADDAIVAADHVGLTGEVAAEQQARADAPPVEEAAGVRSGCVAGRTLSVIGKPNQEDRNRAWPRAGSATPRSASRTLMQPREVGSRRAATKPSSRSSCARPQAACMSVIFRLHGRDASTMYLWSPSPRAACRAASRIRPLAGVVLRSRARNSSRAPSRGTIRPQLSVEFAGEYGTAFAAMVM